MGQCVGRYRRVENYDPKLHGTEIYDKFGNLIAGGSNRVQLLYAGRKLMITNAIQRVMSDFEFLEEDVFRIWKYFLKIDKDGLGYITIGQIFGYINERSYSIIGPYLERFFELIDREYIEKVCYDELLPALVSFNLFSKDEMIMFVFNMFDKDKDGEISKKDLFRQFRQVVDNQQVFPINNMRAIELINLERGDKITKSEFVLVVQALPYTVFPAFRLQSSMKEMFGGFRFWTKCKKRMDKKEQERKMMAEREKFFQRTKKKREHEYLDKMDFYDRKVAQMNTAYYARQKKLRDKMAHVRIRGRRASDGMIAVLMVHEELRQDIDKLTETRKIIREENPYDMPITRDRMHYSFIWDKFTLFEADNGNEMIVIDPTDARINLEEAISKYANQQKAKKKVQLDTFSSESEGDAKSGQTNTHSNSQSQKPNPQSHKNSEQLNSQEKITGQGDVTHQDGSELLSRSELLRRANDLSDIRQQVKQVKQKPKQIKRQGSDSELLRKRDEYEVSEEEDSAEADLVGRSMRYAEEDQESNESDEVYAEDDDEDAEDDPVKQEIIRQQNQRDKHKKHLPQALKQQNTNSNGLLTLHKMQTQKSMKSQGDQSRLREHSKSHISDDITPKALAKQQLKQLPPLPKNTKGSRMGDQTLSMLSKQYPVLGHKQDAPSILGDRTLSQLEKQFPIASQHGPFDDKMSPGKKFKIMRGKHQAPSTQDLDGASTVKSKWTQQTQNFGAKINNQGKIPQMVAKKKRITQGESIATQEILNLTMSSEVSFNSKLYQQYDVNSMNQSQIKNKIQSRLASQKHIQDASILQQNSKISRSVIKEEDQSISDQHQTKQRQTQERFNHPSSDHTSNHPSDQYGDEYDDEYDEEDQNSDDNPSSPIKMKSIQPINALMSKQPTHKAPTPNKKSNYEMLRGGGPREGMGNEKQLIETGQKVVHGQQERKSPERPMRSNMQLQVQTSKYGKQTTKK